MKQLAAAALDDDPIPTQFFAPTRESGVETPLMGNWRYQVLGTWEMRLICFEAIKRSVGSVQLEESFGTSIRRPPRVSDDLDSAAYAFSKGSRSPKLLTAYMSLKTCPILQYVRLLSLPRTRDIGFGHTES